MEEKIKKNSSNRAFDLNAIQKLKSQEKNVPTQEVVSGIVSEVQIRTTLQLPKSLYIEFKRNVMLKNDITLKDFVIQQMTEAIKNS